MWQVATECNKELELARCGHAVVLHDGTITTRREGAVQKAGKNNIVVAGGAGAVVNKIINKH